MLRGTLPPEMQQAMYRPGTWSEVVPERANARATADLLAHLGLTQKPGPVPLASQPSHARWGERTDWESGEQLILGSQPPWAADSRPRPANGGFRFNADAAPFTLGTLQPVAESQVLTSTVEVQHLSHMARPWRAPSGQEALLSTPAWPSWSAAPRDERIVQDPLELFTQSQPQLLKQLQREQRDQRDRTQRETEHSDYQHSGAALSPEALQLEATAYSVALNALSPPTPPESPSLRFMPG